MACPLLKKLLLDSVMNVYFQPVSNIAILKEVIENVMANKLQRILKQMDYMEYFQSGFMLSHILVNYLYLKLDEGSIPISVPSDFLVVFRLSWLHPCLSLWTFWDL